MVSAMIFDCCHLWSFSDVILRHSSYPHTSTFITFEVSYEIALYKFTVIIIIVIFIINDRMKDTDVHILLCIVIMFNRVNAGMWMVRRTASGIWAYHRCQHCTVWPISCWLISLMTTTSICLTWSRSSLPRLWTSQFLAAQSLNHSWKTKNFSKSAELCCLQQFLICGTFISVVRIWLIMLLLLLLLLFFFA